MSQILFNIFFVPNTAQAHKETALTLTNLPCMRCKESNEKFDLHTSEEKEGI